MRSTILTGGLVASVLALALLPGVSDRTQATPARPEPEPEARTTRREPSLPAVPEWIAGAGARLEAGEPDAALALLESARGASPSERTRVALLEALAAQAAGRPDAVERLDAAHAAAVRARSPLAGFVALRLGQALRASGRAADAVKPLVGASEHGGLTAARARLELADLLEAEGRLDDALVTLHPLAAAELAADPAGACTVPGPHAADALAGLERVAAAAGDASLSARARERLLLVHPCEPEALALLDRPDVEAELALIAQERPADAMARAERLIDCKAAARAARELAPIAPALPASVERDRAHLLLGRALRADGRTAAALTAYEKVSPRDGALHGRAALAASSAAKALKRTGDASRWLQRAADAPASEWRDKAALDLAAAHADAERHREARALWLLVAREGVDERVRATAGWKRAWSLLRSGQRDQALAAMDELAAAVPRAREAAAARYWAARLERESGREALAGERLAALATSFPNDYYGIVAGEEIGAPAAAPCTDCAAADADGVLAARLADVAALDAAAAERAAEWVALGMPGAALEELAAVPAEDEASRRVRRAAESLVLARTPRRTEALRAFREAYPDWRLRTDIAPAAWCAVYPRSYAHLVDDGSRRHGLDAALVYGLIHQESVFEAEAVSWAGARGLMQVMPATGRTIAGWLGEKVTTQRLVEPELNVRYGTTYLARLVEGLPHVELALAGYNAGGTRARRWWSDVGGADVPLFVESIPFDETRDYVKAITFNRRFYRLAWLGSEETPLSAAGTAEPLAGGAGDEPAEVLR